MQEEDPLAEAPQRRGAELVARRRALQNVVRQHGPHLVNSQVGEQGDSLIAKRRNIRLVTHQRGRVAHRTTDAAEGLLAVRNGSRAAWSRRRGSRRRQVPHVKREIRDVAIEIPQGDGTHLPGDVIGFRLELTGRIEIPLGLEELVRDALLDVVGLAGEQQQRDVLRLPAVTGDPAIVGIRVEMPGNSECLLLRRIRRQVGGECRIGNVLNQTRP